MPFEPVKKVEEESFKPVGKVEPQTEPELIQSARDRETIEYAKRRARTAYRPPQEPIDPGLKVPPYETDYPFKQPDVLTGRTTGATIGAIKGGSKGGVPGAIVGAIMGGILGEQATIVQEIADDNPHAPKSKVEIINRMVDAGLVSAIEESIGQVPVAVGNRVLNPFQATMTDEGKVATQVLNKYMPKSRITGKALPGVTAAEATENRWLDLIQNISEKSWTGGPHLSRFGTRPLESTSTRAVVLNKMWDDLLDGFGPRMDTMDLGSAITETAKSNWQLYRDEITTPLYNGIKERTKPIIEKIPQYEMRPAGLAETIGGKPLMKEVQIGMIEKEIGGVKVDISSLKKTADEWFRAAKKAGGLESEQMGDDIAIVLNKTPDKIQVSTAIDIRTRLMAKRDKFSIENPKAPAVGKAKKAIGELTEIIDKGLQKYDPAIAADWRMANDLYKQGNAQFNNRIVRGLIQLADPKKSGRLDQVMYRVYQKGGIETIQKVKAAVGPRMWQKTKNWYMQEVITKAANKNTGVVDGATIQAQFFSKSGKADEFVKSIFTADELSKIKGNAISAKLIQARQASGLGGFLIQMLQAPAAVGLLTKKWQETSQQAIPGLWIPLG